MRPAHNGHWHNKFRKNGATQYSLSRLLAFQQAVLEQALFESDPDCLEVLMLSTKRYAAVLSSLLIAAIAPHALAAGQPARLDVDGCEKPAFPTRWQTDSDGGDVLVAFLVGSDGKVKESKVIESSGDVRVDRASARAAARCHFTPAARDGKAVASWTQVRYSWVLN